MSAQRHEATSGSAVPTDRVEQLVEPVVESAGPFDLADPLQTKELSSSSSPPRRVWLRPCAWPIWRLAEDPPLHSWYLETFECLDGATHRLVRMVLENLAKGLVRVGLQD